MTTLPSALGTKDRMRVGFMALLYAVQAATGNPGLAYLPVAAHLTRLGFSAAQLAGFQAAVLLPWVTKPLWALLIDGLALRGVQTKGVLVICLGLMVVGFGWLSQNSAPTVNALWLGLGGVSTLVAIADVLSDRWMVVEGRRHQRGNLYQAAQWVGWGGTAMAMFVVGGWLADRMPLHQVFGWSLVVPGCALLLVAWKLPETVDNSLPKPTSGRRLYQVLGQADLRAVLGLGLLIHLCPLPVDYLYQVQELGFDNRLVGQLKAVESVGTALGALGFGLWAWRSPQLPLLGVAVVGQAGALLSLVALTDATSAYGVYLLRGLCTIVSFLGLFGRVVAVCPPPVAGFSYALIVSVSNLAVSLGAVVGGTLYDLGLSFQGVALVGVGYTLLVGLWLMYRR
jgi:hypothetical protein